MFQSVINVSRPEINDFPSKRLLIMKCHLCGKYTFDEHNVCINCGEKYGLCCTTTKCLELHV